MYVPVVKEGEEGVLNNSRAHERNGKERGKMRVAKRLYSHYDSDYCLLILRRFALMTCPRSDRSSKVGVKLYSPDPPLESDVTVPESQPHGYPPWEEE